MDIYWLRQTEADLPVGDQWLSAAEILRLVDLRFPKRRADWRLGRWTAKHAVGAYLNRPAGAPALAEIELRPMPCGAPEVFVCAARTRVSVSLTHRAGVAVCAVGPPGGALGCDLEVIEPHSDGFVADYFTAEEQATVAQAPLAERPRLLALLWSAKESALKALHAGLRLDTRSVAVASVGAPCPQQTWLPLLVRYNATRRFHGWWRYEGDLLLTMIAEPRPTPPTLLQAPERSLSIGNRMLFQPVRIPHGIDVSQCAASHTAGENP